MSSLVKRTRTNRMYYAENIDMRLSFDGLNKLAMELVGAQTETGDILVCDNPNKTKRKLLQRTATGFMIYYARLDNKTEFTPLADKNGLVRRIPKEIV